MDRNDVDWKGYWPSCPTPFHPGDESSTWVHCAPSSSSTSAVASTGCSSTARSENGSLSRKANGAPWRKPLSSR